MKKFSIIVAIDDEGGIGKKGDLAWRLAADLKHFKEVTTKTISSDKQNAIIMGRKTWDSLPEKFRPLPGRLNIVLSQKADLLLPGGVLLFHGLEEAINFLSAQASIDQIFIIGGAQVYGQAIHHPNCERLYVTHVKGDFDCDAFFPEIPGSFKKFDQSALLSESTIHFQFVQYQKTT